MFLGVLKYTVIYDCPESSVDRLFKLTSNAVTGRERLGSKRTENAVCNPKLWSLFKSEKERINDLCSIFFKTKHLSPLVSHSEFFKHHTVSPTVDRINKYTKRVNPLDSVEWDKVLQ